MTTQKEPSAEKNRTGGAICGDGMCPYVPCKNFPKCGHLEKQIQGTREGLSADRQIQGLPKGLPKESPRRLQACERGGIDMKTKNAAQKSCSNCYYQTECDDQKLGKCWKSCKKSDWSPKRTKEISSGSVENLPVHTPRKEGKPSLSAKAEKNRTEKWKNGFSDGSGKGTITFSEKSKLRVHWGCSCCDYFDVYSPSVKDKKLIRFADRIVKILNEQKVKP